MRLTKSAISNRDFNYFQTDILSAQYRDVNRLEELSCEFAKQSYIKLPGLINEDLYQSLRIEVLRLIGLGSHRDFTMPGYETPRLMTTLGGRSIATESPTVASLYVNYQIREMIYRIATQTVHSCQHEDEFIVLNHLAGKNETHGWHLDDPAIALIIVFQCPKENEGGSLQYVTPDDRIGAFCDQSVDSIIARAKTLGLINSRSHAEMDGYLLRADKVLHRVAPIESDKSRRTALNLAFETALSPRYGKTASLLYSAKAQEEVDSMQNA